MTVITISGQAQHGKDTSANYLKSFLEQHGKKVLIIHYADYLKYIANKYFGWDGQKDERGRSILQYIGTDVVRKKNPNFWVNTVIEFIRIFNDYDYILIPDTRFPSEIDRLREENFNVISLHVERYLFDNGLTEEQKNHPSETALNDYQFDYCIVVEGGIHCLHDELDKFIKNRLCVRYA